jgi:transposase InsO family protein
VIVVDERHRLPIGRPYLTAAIDVCSRCVVGLVVTLNATSATSVGLCLAHTATDNNHSSFWHVSASPRMVSTCQNPGYGDHSHTRHQPASSW